MATRRTAGKVTSIDTAQAPTTDEAKGLSTADLLAGNFGGNTSPSVATQMPTFRQKNARIRAEADALTEKVGQIVGMSEDEKATTRADILNAQLENLRTSLPTDQRALAEIVSSLTDSITEMDQAFADVQKFTSEEARIFGRAEEAHAAAMQRDAAATTALKKAETAWNIFGRRARLTASATAEKTAAEAAVKSAFDAIAKAKTQAENARSVRLQGADFEESYKLIESAVRTTKAVLVERIGMLTKQSDSVQEAKVKSYQNKVNAAKQMEDLAADVERLAAKYAAEVQVRDSLEGGTEARAKKELEVSELQKEHQETKARHDQMLVVFQAMEKATAKLEIDEASLRSGLHAHKVGLANLTASSEIWLVEFQTRLAQIKGMASSEATAQLLQMGSVVRQQAAKSSAQFAIASLDSITVQAENHPAEMNDLGNIASAMSEGLQGITERWKKIDADARSRGGISGGSKE